MVTTKTTLTSEEHARIHAAVADVERGTSAAFALAIVPVSDRYLLHPVVWGAIIGLAATGVAALLHPGLTIAQGFLVDAMVFAALTLVLDWLPLRLLIVPKRVKHNHARQLAHREFAAHVIAAQHRNSVLFFVSLGERYVEILADREVHARVEAGTWDRLVAEFVAAVKAGHLTEGFVTAAESCGALLETHYPRSGASPPSSAGSASAKLSDSP
jgi:putative membrane protein